MENVLTTTITIDGTAYPITHCPPMAAEGCFDGVTLTVKPSNTRYALYTGLGNPYHFHCVHGSRLWPQEEYVYRQEIRGTIQDMIERLHISNYLPRRPGRSAVVEPLPEDFGEVYFPDNDGK